MQALVTPSLAMKKGMKIIVKPEREKDKGPEPLSI